eukprot:jgi/Mesen1/7364/ME000381S06597
MRTSQILFVAAVAIVMLSFASSPAEAARGRRLRSFQLDADFESTRSGRSADLSFGDSGARRHRGRIMADDPAAGCGPFGNGTTCGKTCTDITSDELNCGACGTLCSVNEICCASTCVAFKTDAANCGTCGNACGAGVTCSLGLCGY